MNICVEAFVWTYVFTYLRYTPKVELLAYMVTLCLTF